MVLNGILSKVSSTGDAVRDKVKQALTGTQPTAKLWRLQLAGGPVISVSGTMTTNGKSECVWKVFVDSFPRNDNVKPKCAASSVPLVLPTLDAVCQVGCGPFLLSSGGLFG